MAKLDERLERFLENHWPHMERRVGRLEGESRILISLAVVMLAGIITLLVKAW